MARVLPNSQRTFHLQMSRFILYTALWSVCENCQSLHKQGNGGPEKLKLLAQGHAMESSRQSRGSYLEGEDGVGTAPVRCAVSSSWMSATVLSKC